MPAVKPLRYRQIHLDFHTSEHIPDVGGAFDAEDFVATLKAAHVDSVTVFAKCHHGWSYYPTTVGACHPHLARPDLMGEMIRACAAADIETPVYITVQWDERSAREHPEWRVMSATNRFQRALPDDPSSLKQLSPAWHTLCLIHPEVRDMVLAQAREVASTYEIPGLFFDIVMAPDCVCPACIDRMVADGLDPENPDDRLAKDEAVNEAFRRHVSEALFAEFPGLRVFYNCGHIHKQGRQRFATYTHLELESLPTGGWGYDHFPVSARYAAALGFDFLGQTGKFHTHWGEFGGFKTPQALVYETGQMVALGAKCLVGDQLHPDGAINHDTYRSIAPAYERVARLEPFLRGARQVSEIAILAAEFFHPRGDRNTNNDDGAAQMLQELKLPFDVIDGTAALAPYRLVILPDTIPVDEALAARLRSFVGSGGKLILSGRSGRSAEGFALDLGVTPGATPVPFVPSYLRADPEALDPGLPASPFVMYGQGESITAGAATVLASIVPSYFNRSYRHFCSHQHTPDDPSAGTLGAGVTEHDGIGYIAFPIFAMYQAYGQPLYKYVVRGLIRRLLPDPVLTTDLPSGGRATLVRQEDERRHVLHLLYGAPQVRGKGVPTEAGSSRVIEMIEDVPAIGPVTAELRLGYRPARVYDALTGAEVDWHMRDDGRVALTLPRLHIHSALVLTQG